MSNEPKALKGKAAKSAPEALIILWSDGFFKTWKPFHAIVEILAKRGNNFDPGDMAVALMRAKHLTRRGKKMKYEYIQKYPHSLVKTSVTNK